MEQDNIEQAISAMQKNAERAEAMLKLLANAKRLMILCHLVKEAMPVGKLADIVGLSSSALSQHLAKMREQGLVDADRRGQMVYYSISSTEAASILATLYNVYCNKG